MDLVTLDYVKVQLAGGDNTALDSTGDALLKRLITRYSKRVERAIAGDPGLQKIERTQFYDHFGPSHRVMLRNWPVAMTLGVPTDTFKVWVSGDRTFAATGDLLDGDPNGDYFVDGRLGYLEIDWTYLQSEFGPGVIKVQYTGGFGVDAQAIVDNYPDLAGAVSDQVIYHWRRRANLGGNISAGGGSQQVQGTIQLVDTAKEVIKDLKRNHVG